MNYEAFLKLFLPNKCYFCVSLSHTEKVWLPFDISQEWQIDILNKKIPAVFIYSAGIFLSIISRITPLSSSCSSADTFSPTYSKSVQSPLRCRHSNRDSLLLYNRSMGDLAFFYAIQNIMSHTQGLAYILIFQFRTFKQLINISSQITATKPFSFFIFVFLLLNTHFNN